MFEANEVPDDEIRKITHENAMRWYSFDPFTHVPKAEATVGALRRSAAGHDVSVMSRSTRVTHARREARGLPPAGQGRGRGPGLTRRPPRTGSGLCTYGRRDQNQFSAVSRSPEPAASRRIASPAASTWASASVRAAGPSPRPMASSSAACSLRLRALLFGEELEVAGRHHPDRLAQEGQQPRRARRQVEGPVEASVGRHHVVAVEDGVGQRAQLGQLRVGDACGGPLGRLAARARPARRSCRRRPRG